MKKSTAAHLALILVTIIWGATFPLIRQALVGLDSFWFVFFRFLAAAVLFAGMLQLSGRLHWDKAMFKWGLALGVLNSLSYILQTKGLETVPSARAAFITGLNVVMVPLLAIAFKVAKSRAVDYISATLAALGLYILCNPSQSPFTWGDGVIVMSALFYSLFVLSLQSVSRKFTYRPSLLACYQVFGVLLSTLLFLPLAKTPMPTRLSTEALWAIIFCASFATVGVFWLQTNFQKHTTPQRAAVIFSLEPLFAGLFGYWLINEKIGLNEAIGGAVIIFACLLPEIKWKKFNGQ